MIFPKLSLFFLLFIVKFNPIACEFQIPECIDSPLKLLVDDDVNPRRRCGWAANHGYCDQNDVASHCPVSCGTCDTYHCEDSTAEVLWYDATVHTCSSLTNLEASEIDYYCNSEEKIAFTCRSTCGYCEESAASVVDFEDAAHIVPYSIHQESGLTFDNNIYGMEANQGYQGSGYEYGTVSGVMTVFNGWATPGTIFCVGGSFTLKEVYITPAWESGISYTFTGTKSGGGTVSKSVTLGSTTSPILYNDWADFTDLASIYFACSSGCGNSHIVFDDMVVEIDSPCTTGGSSSIVDRPLPATNGSDPAGPIPFE